MKEGYLTKTLHSPQCTAQMIIDFYNERIRILNYRGNVADILELIKKEMEPHQITKVLFYARTETWRELLKNGYQLEAVINGYFSGSDCYIMTNYIDNKRRTSPYWLQGEAIISSILKKERNTEAIVPIPSLYTIRRGKIADSEQLAALYKQVFELYPVPISNPDYIQTLINNGTIFYVVEYKNSIVSAASADLNSIFHHAEVTDCATLKEHRKYGFMKKLIALLESDLKASGIFCVFSIARALSYGMNAALFQMGYEYSGRLINNCYIFDKIEDMNVWVKDLAT